MSSERFISIVIANYNMASTIGKCLEAVFSSKYENFEVVVVDDNSEDNSVEIIKQFPCKLIRLDKHVGASKVRNIGASDSNGDIIFFTDADCLLKENTLSIINKTLAEISANVVLGGTYTKIPADKGFFSLFQSVFINYSETKKVKDPDYIATHAMVINARTFRKSNGFSESCLPILEDVEFSHRLRKTGHRLVINPLIEVRHIFNFSLSGSMRNAIKKSMYWTIYSLKNKDLLVDSGTASAELKVNIVSYFLCLLLLSLWLILQKLAFLYPLPLIFVFNGFVSRGLFRAFYETKGLLFTGLASMYYLMLYPLPVGTGTIRGVVNFLSRKGAN